MGNATVRLTAPNGDARVIHTAMVGADSALCGRSVVGWLPLPADPWARMAIEHWSTGPCQRCARRNGA